MSLENVGTFIISDSSLDRHSQRIMPEGLNIKSFKKNPVMYYNHHRSHNRHGEAMKSLPIGVWKNIKLKNGKWQAEAHVDTSDDFGQRLATKVQLGVIRSASIGVRVLGVSHDEKDKVKGQRGVTVKSAELLEVSLVDIPANKNAIKIKGDVSKSVEGETEETEQFYYTSYSQEIPQEEIQEKNISMIDAIKDLFKKKTGQDLPEGATIEDVQKALNELPDFKEEVQEIKNTVETTKADQDQAIKAVDQKTDALSNSIKALTDSMKSLQGSLEQVVSKNTDLESENTKLKKGIAKDTSAKMDANINAKGIESEEIIKSLKENGIVEEAFAI